MAEQAIGLAILGVVAVLGTWPPAIEAMMESLLRAKLGEGAASDHAVGGHL